MPPTPKPISLDLRNSRRSSTTRPPSNTPGRARFPGAGLVARPCARADARASRTPLRRRARWSTPWSKRAAAKEIAGDWERRAIGDRRQRRLSRARPADRSRYSHCGDHARRATARGGSRTATRFMPRRCVRRRRPTLRPTKFTRSAFTRSPRSAPSSTRSCTAAGYTRGSVGDRLSALNTDAGRSFTRTRTPAAPSCSRASMQASKDMYARLPRAFATLPDQPLEIRRVPPEIQDGASNGYYRRASLDGSRPAIYFINLKEHGDWPKYTLPSLTYHEGVPGHHLQISIAQESQDIADAPQARLLFSAYGEGWALYAEQLADELGGYAGHRRRAGFLQSLPVPRGAAGGRHRPQLPSAGAASRRPITWSPPPALPAAASQREVERYCASIGQACSYKVGHIAWMRARAEAQKTLGAKFDIKQFHEVLQRGRDAAVDPRAPNPRADGSTRLSADRHHSRRGHCRMRLRACTCDWGFSRRDCGAPCAAPAAAATSEDARFASVRRSSGRRIPEVRSRSARPSSASTATTACCRTYRRQAVRGAARSPNARSPSSRNSTAHDSAASIRSTRSCSRTSSTTCSSATTGLQDWAWDPLTYAASAGTALLQLCRRASSLRWQSGFARRPGGWKRLPTFLQQAR